MGNRAVITTTPFNEDNVGIYVHWNGGRESIEAFIGAAKALEYRPPSTDDSYALAGLTGLIWSFLGRDGLSLGVGRCRDLDCDNGDNGVWLIGPGWEIAGRHSGKPGAKASKSLPPLTKKDEEKRDAILKDILEHVATLNSLREKA